MPLKEFCIPALPKNFTDLMPSLSVILITGASGRIGRRVAALLASEDHQLRLMTRTPEGAPSLPGAETIYGDFNKPATLIAAFEGATKALIISASGKPGERALLHKNAFQAAVQARVQHVVYLSLLGAGQQSKYPFSRDHYVSEQYLLATDVPSTILRNAFYIDMFLEKFDVDGIVRGPAGVGKGAFVSREDVARTAASALLAEASGILEVTGAESVTVAEVASRFSALTHRVLQYENEPPDLMRKRLSEGELDNSVVDLSVGWFEAIAVGELDHVSDTVLRLTGRQPLSLEDYFRLFPDLLSALWLNSARSNALSEQSKCEYRHECKAPYHLNTGGGNRLLTSDKLTLSLVTLPAIYEQNTEIVLSDNARKYLANSKSARTRKAYRSDLKHFTAFCESQNVSALPATPTTVAAYLVMLAEAGRKPATMSRRLAAISKAHSAAQVDSPASTKHAVVKEVWAGIRRTIGTAQTTKAAATTEYVKQMLAQVPSTLTGLRDRALILLCFAGGMRRSEVVALTIGDVAYVPEGLVITIRGSKTDQERAGQKVAIALGKNAETCPVRSLRAWLLKGGITSGALFRGVTRWGKVQTEALTDQVVATLVKKYARLAGLDDSLFSGHSLRAGLATSASKIVGVDERIIMKQTRHKSEAMVRRYIRDGSLFSQNISGMVGL